MANQSILVVDDEPGIRLYLKRLLGNAGFDVRTAADGNEAVTSLEAEPPDLVILDVMVGGRDGYEICEIVKRDPASAGIKVLMLSAKSRAIEIEKGMALGADAYLTKPFSMDELRDMVRDLLAGAGGGDSSAQRSSGEGAEPLNDRLSLRLRVFLFFALIAIGGCAAIAAAMVYLGRTAAAPKVDDLVLMGGAAGAVVLGLATWVWLKFDEHVVRPIIAVGNHLKAVTHAKAERAMPKGTARYLGFLEPVVQEVTSAFAETRREVGRTVASATQGSEQKNQYLATILRDLQQGVVICNLSHQVLLYNQRALEILHVSGEIGLGRSFFCRGHRAALPPRPDPAREPLHPGPLPGPPRRPGRPGDRRHHDRQLHAQGPGLAHARQ